ncbi:Inositol hexakisphosphate and diphosphoinositol-pentakisphosphate kinase 1 [Microtus ochrogaster]|uniref:Inositol hexakisphosphate and diphosphoinositol-pentakisphosphate kinase 1 n=1 Tax=Microtus ochrogaster TaxID=79684 RepID=A0A8J6GEW8_MICOH|nr:Inositol hexakisphosphate and diphosphoinositol-pentakisphosphate kinase 1 [Microtus ochrogaster]
MPGIICGGWHTGYEILAIIELSQDIPEADKQSQELTEEAGLQAQEVSEETDQDSRVVPEVIDELPIEDIPQGPSSDENTESQSLARDQQRVISRFPTGLVLHQPSEPVAFMLADTLARARPGLTSGMSQEVGLLA